MNENLCTLSHIVLKSINGNLSLISTCFYLFWIKFGTENFIHNILMGLFEFRKNRSSEKYILRNVTEFLSVPSTFIVRFRRNLHIMMLRIKPNLFAVSQIRFF